MEAHITCQRLQRDEAKNDKIAFVSNVWRGIPFWADY